LSSQLNELGFMTHVGNRLGELLAGLPALPAAVLLIVSYVVLHYIFVSQTAHLLALFGVFLRVGVGLGIPAAPLAFQLLFATNYFAAITPQGSSANLLFAGSGFLSQGELYRYGGLFTAFVVVLYLVIGTPWLLVVAQ
jgi:DASS family divalent anion:Na+ symporter